MPAPRKELVRFGDFEIDSGAGELRKSGVPVKLQLQPLKVLLILVNRAGDLLTRAQIEQEIWGDQVHVDFTGGLNFCIKQIRIALQDDAGKPRYIETMPRQGYRFIATVERQAYRARRDERIMLAVLPFGNLTGQPDQEYFTDGMTEELIAQLSRINPQRLGIIAFTSAKQYKDSAKSIDQIGRELGVSYILEGSVRRAGNRVRIAAQLVEVADQCHLWAEAYNRTLDDIITIQTDVAGRVAHSLALELLPANRTKTAHMSGDPVAFEAYLRGRFYWNKRNESGFVKALKYFQSAMERAPDYPPPYVGMADVYKIAAVYSGLPAKEAYDKSRAAITKALQLDRNYAEAHASLAYDKFLYEWDFAGAERAFQYALELNPNHVTGHYWYALYLAAMKRFSEAIAQMDLALELDPLSLVANCNKGQVLYFARRFDEAAMQLLNTIEMDEEFPLARFVIGLVYLQMGQYDNAAEQFTRARETSDDHPAAMAGLAAAKARLKKTAEAKSILAELEKPGKRREVSPYYLAIGYLGLADKARAFRCLERACDERSVHICNLDADPAFDALRSVPGFAKLLQRIGFPIAV